jgi:hypothetical protein
MPKKESKNTVGSYGLSTGKRGTTRTAGEIFKSIKNKIAENKSRTSIDIDIRDLNGTIPIEQYEALQRTSTNQNTLSIINQIETLQARQAENAADDVAGQMKLPETIKTKTSKTVQTSIGAAKNIDLDRKLNQAVSQQKTIYTKQQNGKWINSQTKPAYGDYYIAEAGEVKFVESVKEFADERKAIKAGQYVADNTQKPVYIVESKKGYELQSEKPESSDYTEILPSGEGLTADEKEVFDTPMRRAEAEIAQQEGKKVGYKQGQKNAMAEAFNKLTEMKMAEKLTEKHRTDAYDIVAEYIPKEKQAGYIKRILNAKTGKRVQRIIDAIEQYVKAAEKRLAIRELKNFITKVKSDYSSGKVKLGGMRKDVRE